MATLWDVVTGNSTLPVQAGNTFWDHINNQKTGDVFVGVPLTASIDVDLTATVDNVLSANVVSTVLTANIIEE